MKKFLPILVMGLCITPYNILGGNNLDKNIQDLFSLVDARYEQIQDFQADFIQEVQIEGFGTPLVSSGHMYIKKPGRLRWDYIEPSAEQMYVNGDQVEMYVPEHNQILKGNLTMMAANKAPLSLLQGIGKLAEQFEVSATGNGERGDGGLPLLTLIPKQQSTDGEPSVTRIVSEIHPQTYFIQRVSLHETSGNISTFRFTNLQANTGLDDQVFDLVPPEGVTIIEDIIPY